MNGLYYADRLIIRKKNISPSLIFHNRTYDAVEIFEFRILSVYFKLSHERDEFRSEGAGQLYFKAKQVAFYLLSNYENLNYIMSHRNH